MFSCLSERRAWLRSLEKKMWRRKEKLNMFVSQRRTSVLWMRRRCDSGSLTWLSRCNFNFRWRAAVREVAAFFFFLWFVHFRDDFLERITHIHCRPLFFLCRIKRGEKNLFKDKLSCNCLAFIFKFSQTASCVYLKPI